MDASARIDSCLLDVTGLSMDALDEMVESLPGNVLGAMLRRVVDEAVNPVGVSSASFDSAI
ncbi:FxSxx-COOH cyclophane-containing RiPP peptide [Streptomyces adonidis]|uniref:FxSxx-COOH cyclophane-containing RiPP peptide n=1 Tax=Streptomyces adonidis TaxID=3231367 RepID=UPI0034DB3E4C